uniref:CLAP1 n=1 Tax=Ganoderma boninense TaxID=34458 RepID=A0A5K1JYF2_9APHY|nr:CLAP1 [Ganoderma boninense]
MPSKGNAPESYLPQVMAQSFSAAPSSTPMEHRPRGPPPTLISFFPPSHLPSSLERMMDSGGSSQHALPGNLFVPQGCLHSAAQEVGAASAPLLQPLRLPNHFAPSPCHLTPCVVERLEQYAASAPIPPSHLSSQNQNIIGTVNSGAESTFTAVNAHGTFTPSATPSLYSDAGSRSPSMDLPLSPWSAGAQTSGWTLPRTTQGSAGGTDYVGAVCRDFSPADRRLSSSPSSEIVRGLTPELVECYLATAQKMGVMHVPRAFRPARVDNPVNATSFPRVGKQDSRDVREVVQGVSPTHSVSSSLPLAVAPYADRPRSCHIEGMDSMHVYSHDVPIQHKRALPPSTSDAAAYSPKQSPYSELSLALQEGAPELKNQHARTSIESMGKRAWATVPQEANVGYHEPPYGSTFGRYQQGLIVDYPQSEMAMSTHLWSQSAYNSPQYPHNARTSTSAMEMMA